MAKIRNVSGEDRFVPSLSRLVMDGQVIEVDPEQVYAFTQSAIWEAVDKAAQTADLEAEADYQARLAEAEGITPDPEPEPEPEPEPVAEATDNTPQEG